MPIMTKRLRFVKSALIKRRIESLVDKLGLNTSQWGRLCRVLLPEEYRGPRRKCKPTKILPGPAKVQVFAKRYEKEQELFTDEDGKHHP